MNSSNAVVLPARVGAVKKSTSPSGAAPQLSNIERIALIEASSVCVKATKKLMCILRSRSDRSDQEVETVVSVILGSCGYRPATAGDGWCGLVRRRPAVNRDRRRRVGSSGCRTLPDHRKDALAPWTARIGRGRLWSAFAKLVRAKRSLALDGIVPVLVDVRGGFAALRHEARVHLFDGSARLLAGLDQIPDLLRG